MTIRCHSSDEPIPFALPAIGREEIESVCRVLESGWLTTGEETREFEREFAASVGAPHAVAVNSATAGLHLALEALGVGLGDRVLVPTWTFTATAEVVRHVGAIVELVDVDESTLLLDLDSVERRMREDPPVRAVIPVHFAGQTCDMERLLDVARRRGVAVIEDAAHAFPATSGGRPVGSLGDATVFSFYATKTITTGEGGMVTTAKPALAKRMRTMRLHGIDRDVFDRYRRPGAGWRYDVVAAGFKYNLTDMAAAIGRVQLKRAESLRAARETIAAYYLESLADLPLRLPVRRDVRDGHAWHLFVIQVLDAAPVDRDTLSTELARRGIGTSVHFRPLHHHPFWKRHACCQNRLDRADRAFERVLSLPLYATLTDRQARRVVQALREILQAGRSGCGAEGATHARAA